MIMKYGLFSDIIIIFHKKIKIFKSLNLKER